MQLHLALHPVDKLAVDQRHKEWMVLRHYMSQNTLVERMASKEVDL